MFFRRNYHWTGCEVLIARKDDVKYNQVHTRSTIIDSRIDCPQRAQLEPALESPPLVPFGTLW